MKYKRPGRKRLSVDVPDDLFEAIQFLSKLRNITITRWVLRALYARLKIDRALEDTLQAKKADNKKHSAVDSNKC